MYVKTLSVASCSSLRKSYICTLSEVKSFSHMLAFQKVSLAVYSHPCVRVNTSGRETITLQSFFMGDLIHFWMMRDLPPICKGTQGVKKVSLTVCHLGKLYLACTSLRVSLTALKKVFDEQDCIQFFCNLNSPKNFTCPAGKLRREFTSPIAQSTSGRLLDTNFIAHWDLKKEIILVTRSDL